MEISADSTTQVQRDSATCDGARQAARHKSDLPLFGSGQGTRYRARKQDKSERSAQIAQRKSHERDLFETFWAAFESESEQVCHRARLVYLADSIRQFGMEVVLYESLIDGEVLLTFRQCQTDPFRLAQEEADIRAGYFFLDRPRRLREEPLQIVHAEQRLVELSGKTDSVEPAEEALLGDDQIVAENIYLGCLPLAFLVDPLDEHAKAFLSLSLTHTSPYHTLCKSRKPWVVRISPQEALASNGRDGVVCATDL